MGNKKFVIIGENLFLIALFQIIFSYFLKIKLFPNLLLIWVLYLGWNRCDIFSLIGAMVAGIIYDLIVKGSVGWSSLIFLIIAYLNEVIGIQTLKYKIIFSFLSSLFYFFFISLEPSYGFVWKKLSILKFSIIFSFFNVICVMVVEFYIRMRWKRRGFLKI
ncbi:MAG: hypothetical protein DRP67_04380 [Candidatus Omnitrophota bacterium]|nr:MAG: hypothetical protein DRP67_04380 [Candidatus Omnitrophota bacterium]